MSSTPDTVTTPVVSTPYATRPGGTRSRRRVGRLLLALVILAGGAFGTLVWPGIPGLSLERGGQAADTLYEVQPVTLNITLKEDGELKPVNSVELKCEAQGGGLTIEWVVDESTQVKKGDELLRLASDEFEERLLSAQMEVDSAEAALLSAQSDLELTLSENESALEKARVKLEVAQLELQRYLKGDFENKKKSIEIEIEKTEMNLKQKRDELDKSLPLVERGFVTLSKIEELDSAVKQLEMTLAKHELELETLHQYDLPKNKMQKEADVSQAVEELKREEQRAASRKTQSEGRVREKTSLLEQRRRQFERLNEQLAKCTIKAPLDGIVQYGESGGGRWWNGNRIAAGEQVHPGQTLLTIPDTSQMMVSTRIHEADRHMITDGLPCLVRVPAVPGHVLHGRLSKIAQFADSERSWLNPDLKEHAAEILLDETDADISPGDTAHVEILIEEVPDVLAVPVQCVFSRGAKRFVFVANGYGGAPAEVKLGRSSATLVEVGEGLRAGDRVLMHVDDRLLAMLPSTVSTPMDEMPGGKKRGSGKRTHDATAAQTGKGKGARG